MEVLLFPSSPACSPVAASAVNTWLVLVCGHSDCFPASLLHMTSPWDFTCAAAPFLRHIEEGVASQTVFLRSYSTLLQSTELLCLPHPKPPKSLQYFADLMSGRASVWFFINSSFETRRITFHVWFVNSAPWLLPLCGYVHFLIHFLQLLDELLISDMRWKLFSGLFSCLWTCLYFYCQNIFFKFL